MQSVDGDVRLSVGFNTKSVKQNINDLRNTISSGMQDASSKVIQLQNNIEKAADKIELAKNKLKEFEGMKAIPSSDYKTLVKELNNVEKQINDIIKTQEQWAELGISSQSLAFKDLDNQIESLERTYDELKAKKKAMEDSGTAFGDTDSKYQKLVNNLNSAVREYKLAQAKLNEFNNSQREGVSSSNKTSKAVKESANNTKKYLSSLSGTTKKVFKEIGNKAVKTFSTIAKKAKSVISSIIKQFSRMGKSSNKSFNDSVYSIGNIIKMMIKFQIAMQAIYLVTNSISTAIRDGFKNLAGYSSDVNSQIVSVLSSWTKLKNQIAATLEPLLNVVVPIINEIIAKFTEATAAIGEFFAALTGQDYVYKALDTTTEYLEDTASATEEAAKATEDYLSPLDDLNKFSDNTTVSASSATTGTEADPSTMFETVSVSERFKKFANEIKKLFKSKRWKKLGELIAENINKLLKKIDWTDIKNTCAYIANSIGTFINGFIEKFDWSLLGSTIAEGINSIMITIRNLAVTIDWTKFGKSIANSFNSFISKFDWSLLGDLLASALNIPIKLAMGFAYEFDWSEFGKSLKTSLEKFIKEFKIEDLGDALGKILEGIATVAQELFDIDWTTLGEKLGNSLKNFFSHDPFGNVVDIIKGALGALFDTVIGLFTSSDFDPTELGKDVAEAINNFFSDKEWWEKAGQTVNETAEGILEFLDSAIGELNPEDLADAILEFFSEIDWSYLAVKLGELIFKTIAQAFAIIANLIWSIPGVKDFISWQGIDTDDLNALFRDFMEEATIYKDPDTGEWYKYSSNEFATGEWYSQEEFKKIDEELQEIFEKYGESAKYAFLNQGGMEGIDRYIEIYNSMGEKAADAFAKGGEDGLLDYLYSIPDLNTKEQSNKSGNEIGSELVTGMAYSMNENSGKVNKQAVGLGNTTEKGINSKAGNIQTATISPFNTAWASIKNIFSASAIKNFFVSVCDNIKKAFNVIPDWFKTTFSNAWQNVKNVFSTGGKIFSGIKDGILSGLKTVINGLIDGINNVISVPFNGLNTALSKIRDIQIAGFKPFEWISTIGVPQIPKLAQGAVIPPNKEFMAILGDQTNGRNLEAPESLIRQIVREETAGLKTGGGNVYEIDLKVGRTTLAKLVLDEAKLMLAQSGQNPFELV